LAYATTLIEDTVVAIKGRVRRRDDSMQIQAMEVTLPDVTDAEHQPVMISLPASRCIPPVVHQLKSILSTHPAVTEVSLRLTQPDTATFLRLDDGLRITPSPSVLGDATALWGPSCLMNSCGACGRIMVDP